MGSAFSFRGCFYTDCFYRHFTLGALASKANVGTQNLLSLQTRFHVVDEKGFGCRNTVCVPLLVSNVVDLGLMRLSARMLVLADFWCLTGCPEQMVSLSVAVAWMAAALH